MIRESVDMIFSGTEGSIFISPSTYRQNQILIYNSSFTNVYASYGSAILLKNIGKFFIDNCTFNQTIRFGNSTDSLKYFKSFFKMNQYNTLNSFVDETFLNNLFTQYQPQSGYLDIQGVYKVLVKENDDPTDPIMF